MSVENIINLFVEYELIKKIKSEHKEILEGFDDDIEMAVLGLLQDVAEKREMQFSLAHSEKQIHNSFGESCTPDELIEEFTKDFDEVATASKGKDKGKGKGKGKVKNLQIIPPLNEKGRVDKDKEMSISFISNNKNYEWKFCLDGDSYYADSFAKWVYEALDGDFLYVDDEYPTGYNIPKGLISELEKIGLNNLIHDLM